MQSLSLPDASDDKANLTSPGLAASRAKPPFEPGDTLVELNGNPLKDYAALAKGLAIHSGETVTFGVRRKKAAENDPLTAISVEPNHFRTLGLKMAIRSELRPIPPRFACREEQVETGGHDHAHCGADAKAVGVEDRSLAVTRLFLGTRRQRSPGAGEAREVTGEQSHERRSGIGSRRPARLDRTSQRDQRGLSAVDPVDRCIAYHVLHHVVDVVPDGPAARKGIHKDDHLGK